MTDFSNTVFTVTFTEQLDQQMLDDFVTSEAVGMGEVRVLDEPRIMSLRAYRHEYLRVKSFLDELQDGGALTYVESRA
jgi:hypothetical protein